MDMNDFTVLQQEVMKAEAFREYVADEICSKVIAREEVPEELRKKYMESVLGLESATNDFVKSFTLEMELSSYGEE